MTQSETRILQTISYGWCIPPLPPPLLINKTKPEPRVNAKRDANTSGAGKHDVLSQIRDGTVLKSAKLRDIKDIKPKQTNTLSDILGGALAKIKDANDIYGRNDDPYSEWD